MNVPPKFRDKQYYLLFTLIFLAIWCFAIGFLLLIPEKYHSYYALFASIIFLIDVLILQSLKKGRISEDEKNMHHLFFSIGSVLILVSSILLYMNIQPDYFIFSFVFASSFLTTAVVFQSLRNRNIIS